MGVLYSRAGFTGPAVEKAKKLNIHCCRLYANQPADLPESIVFRPYLCLPLIKLSFNEQPDPLWSTTTWGDVFSDEVTVDAGKTTVLDMIVTVFHEGEQQAIEAGGQSFPSGWSSERSIDESGRPPYKVGVHGVWQYYRGKVEAHLLDGSYSLTDGDFKGVQYSPVIDLRGSSPGPGWELLPERPSSVESGSIIACFHGGDVRTALSRELGTRPVFKPHQNRSVGSA